MGEWRVDEDQMSANKKLILKRHIMVSDNLWQHGFVSNNPRAIRAIEKLLGKKRRLGVSKLWSIRMVEFI